MTIELVATGRVTLPCAFPGCENAARFITIDERLSCSTCLVAHRVDGIRISNVPDLLKVVREYLVWQAVLVHPDTDLAHWAQKFHEIVGKDIST